MRAILVGLGAVGARSARQLLSSKSVTELVVFSRHPAKAGAETGRARRGGRVQPGAAFAGTVLRGVERDVGYAPDGARSLPLGRDQPEGRRPRRVDIGRPSRSPFVAQVGRRGQASGCPGRRRRRHGPGTVVPVGGVGGVTGRVVTEVHVASLGTGGPACARRHHAALREAVEEWRDGVVVRRVGGSGRELVWFPEHAGADCYRVNRPDPLLLARAFPGLQRSRPERRRHVGTVSRPGCRCCRQPHPEGTVGALRVEVRGRRGGAAETMVVGLQRPAGAAGGRGGGERGQ